MMMKFVGGQEKLGTGFCEDNGDADGVLLPQLDPAWYLSTYPDVARVPLDPETHYRLYGCRLGRDPSADVSTLFFQALLKLSPRKDPLRALAKLAKRGVVPKAAVNPGRILWASEELARNGQLERALMLAERWLPSNHRYRANILRANLQLRHGDDSGWLAATNAYLDHFGVGSVYLDGEGSLFDRIQAETPVATSAGPKVSIIVSAWNAERTLEKALRSLLAQSRLNIELLVVDDCSSDSTWEVINQIAAADRRVKAWRNAENVGPYVSKSIAAGYATGDWITCHDADDWAHPERIERQVRFCTENRYSACLSGMLRVSDEGRYTRLSRAGGFVHDGACRSALVSLFMSAQLFHDLLGAWDQVRAGGDSELFHRLETVTGKRVRQLNVPTMFCRDHEQSLTNDQRYGQQVQLDDGVRTRVRYRDSYIEAHKELTKNKSRDRIPEVVPRFEANELQLPFETVLSVTLPHEKQLRHEIVADVVIITTARFPGGNASSTLDELRYFKSHGLRVALVHCPIDPSRGRELSERYDEHADIIYHWSRIGRIETQVLICRGPRVLLSHAFRCLSSKVNAKHAFVVKNNSRSRPDGSAAYDVSDMVRAALALPVESLEFCPISQLMRGELLEYSRESGCALRLSTLDWTPTFDPALYYHAPKGSMGAPYVIGRHGRDGVEKWLEEPDQLLLAYPPEDNFEIHILGGAEQAGEIIGELPGNWRVQEFGEVEPLDFLANLDAFVYFPNSRLVEGFGRTIVEAMIAGVPVIVPESLENTFGELVFVCEPRDVAAVVERLAHDAVARVAFLKEVQQVALARYGAEVIAKRLEGCGLQFALTDDDKRAEGISEVSRRYRSTILRR